MSIKEKFKELKEKTVEFGRKTKQKVTDFAAEHPTLVKVCAIAGAVGIVGIGYAASSNGKKKETAQALPVESETKEEELPYGCSRWDEQYRENWDKVNQFAETLELKPGEEFMISDPYIYMEPDSPDVEMKPLVSHLVDSTGVYPPEEQ